MPVASITHATPIRYQSYHVKPPPGSACSRKLSLHSSRTPTRSSCGQSLTGHPLHLKMRLRTNFPLTSGSSMKQLLIEVLLLLLLSFISKTILNFSRSLLWIHQNITVTIGMSRIHIHEPERTWNVFMLTNLALVSCQFSISAISTYVRHKFYPIIITIVIILVVIMINLHTCIYI